MEECYYFHLAGSSIFVMSLSEEVLFTQVVSILLTLERITWLVFLVLLFGLAKSYIQYGQLGS